HEPPEMPDRHALGFRGHNGIRDWMANLREVGGIEFEPISFTTSGDVVLSELTARGRGQASGVQFEWTTFAVIRVRDAKIVGVESFLSRIEALEAAGLSEW
ncbi:MAG: nuclear transport factor 2 family protein, partial [Solirubrobacterales bacterium]